LEFKSIPFELKDIDSKKGIYTGYFSSINVKDSGGDTVEVGAFQKSFTEWGPSGKNRIKNLWQHDMMQPIGRPLVLKEDMTGAYHETQLSVKSTLGHDAMVLIEDQVITEQSFGYATIKSAPDPKGGRFLKELKVFEYSLVTLGMNEKTPITGTKSLEDQDQLLKRMQQVERILRKGELQSDDLCMALEYELKQWQEAVKEIQTKEPEREVIIVPQERKDFYGRLEKVSVWRDFWMYNEIMESEIIRILRDDNVTDKQTAVSNDIDAFKATMLDWVSRATQSGAFKKEDIEKLEAAKAEYQKEIKKEDSSTPTPSPEDEVVSAIKALVADLKPGNHSDDEQAANHKSDPETIQSVMSFIDELKNQKQGVN
jgi:HK97 family phage prohead protease